ncbi:hypothetical protein ID866_8159, partial [Astraeus odoratus]
CSCDIFKLYPNLKETDNFWIKNTPYSLGHILGHDELTSSFIGGTLFQGLLQSSYYHRWRSPVNGVVQKIRLIAGSDVSEGETPPTYYAACLDDAPYDDPIDDPVGLCCFVGVGLGEVSTCNIIVQEGQQLNKGDELGQFHFGGSTHCLIFGPGLDVTLDTTDSSVSPLDVGSTVRVGLDIIKVTKQQA